MIVFNKPPFVGKEFDFMRDALDKGKISGDGDYTKLCEQELSSIIKSNVLVTTSCTHSLEMIALIEGFNSTDEILVPAFTFVSSALAFNKFGCKIKFIDVDSLTGMSSCDHYVEQINERTRAVVVVHYGGRIATDIQKIASLCKEKNIVVIEDAAQAIGVYLNGKHAGTFGDYGAISFHETKNISSGGEGGALIVANKQSFEEAFIIRDKGTNRRAFFKGMVDKYSWRAKGSSYVMADLNAAYLYAQIQHLNDINNFRRSAYQYYYDGLKGLSENKLIKTVPLEEGNGHMFYLLCSERDRLLKYLRSEQIEATFHYLPLNNSEYVKKNPDIFIVDQEMANTNIISNTIVRLPMYFNLPKSSQDKVISVINDYFDV